MVTITTEIDVLPILIKNISEINAERIHGLIKEAGMDRELKIRNHYITEEGLIVLISGNIGNFLDTLIINLSNINIKNYDYYYEAVQAAKEFVKVLDEDEYKKLKNKNHSKYSQLNDDLSHTFSE